MSGGGDIGGIFWGDAPEGAEGGQSSSAACRVKYREFIRTFRLEDEYVYRKALRSAIVTRQAVMEVDIDHLMEFDEELTNGRHVFGKRRATGQAWHSTATALGPIASCSCSRHGVF